jgi:hypothetical protein
MKHVAFVALVGFLLFIYFEPTYWIPGVAELRGALTLSLVALAAAVLSGARLPQASQNWLLGGFLLWGSVATLSALSYDLSKERFPVLFKAVALYVVIALVVRSRDLIVKFIHLNIALGAVVAIITILTMRAGIAPLGGGDLYRMVNYFGGIGDDPNEFGAFLLALLPLPVLLMSQQKSLVKKGYLAVVALALLLCIIRTRSRGAFVGLIAISPMLFWDMRRRLGQICLAVLALSYAYANTHAGYWERIATAFSEDAIEEDFSASARLHQQDAARQLIARRPFFGVGPGNYVLGKIQLLDHDPAHKMTYIAPHNAYFGLGAEVGLPGLLLLLTTILVTFHSLGRSARSIGPPEDEQLRQIAKALRIGLVGFCLAIFFLSEQYNPILYMWMGMSAVIRALLLPDTATVKHRPAPVAALRPAPLPR